VFKEQSAGGEEIPEGGEEGVEGQTDRKEEDILTTFKGVVFVDEVVREPRMNY